MQIKQHVLLILLPVLAFLVMTPVRAQHYMRINQADGTVMEIAIADIQKLTFDITTAIEQHPELVNQLLRLKAFPDPATVYVMLDYTLPEKGIVNIVIYSLQGLLIERIQVGLQQPGNYNYRVNTLHLASGTYICRVQQNNGSVTQKVIVKH
jgi:hypothetical protein